MRLDLRSPKTLVIFLASFAAGFVSFLLLENGSKLMPGSATAQMPQPVATEIATEAQVNTKAAKPAPQSDPAQAVGKTNGSGEFKPEAGKSLEIATGSNSGSSASSSQSAVIANTSSEPIAATDTPATLTGVVPPQASSPVPVSTKPTLLAQSAQPGYEIAWADPSNYGERFTRDIYNRPANQQPIIVLHETVSSANSAINYFQTPHPNDADQASYHTLIRRNGVVVYLVPPEKRAYGSGNSVFVGTDGREETIKTHKQFSASVNNFAYHISLESPTDGYGNGYSHSGYSQAQYNSLAWLIGQSTVPLDRITTHQRVDRSGERLDPRSFDFRRLQSALRPYRSF